MFFKLYVFNTLINITCPLLLVWCKHSTGIFFFFFAVLHSMRDLSSLSRNWTQASGRGSVESYPLDHQGSLQWSLKEMLLFSWLLLCSAPDSETDGPDTHFLLHMEPLAPSAGQLSPTFLRVSITVCVSPSLISEQSWDSKKLPKQRNLCWGGGPGEQHSEKKPTQPRQAGRHLSGAFKEILPKSIHWPFAAPATKS